MLSAVLALTLIAALPPEDPVATRIGTKAHADAAALQKLPRFDYQARQRWGQVDGLTAVDKVALPEMLHALTGKIADKPKQGEGLTWHEFGFAFDETRFVKENRPVTPTWGSTVASAPAPTAGTAPRPRTTPASISPAAPGSGGTGATRITPASFMSRAATCGSPRRSGGGENRTSAPASR